MNFHLNAVEIGLIILPFGALWFAWGIRKTVRDEITKAIVAREMGRPITDEEEDRDDLRRAIGVAVGQSGILAAIIFLGKMFGF